MRDVAARLAETVRARLGRDDRGAIAVLVAMLLGTGVLLGMAALVVDVGEVYAQRAQLQNGADAAAVAVAKSCALGSCDQSLAQRYANENSASGTAGIDTVCGPDFLVSCAASLGGLASCPDPLPGNLRFVDVFTATKTPSGSSLLAPVFAGALLGGYQGTTVHACAQASWGAPATASAIAFTVPKCAWDSATNHGAQLGPPPSAGSPPQSADVSLHLADDNSVECPAAGSQTFRMIADQPGTCSADITTSTYNGGDRDDADWAACDPAVVTAQANHSVQIVPVHVSSIGSNDHISYTLAGFAAFVVTGYNLPDSDGDSALSASDWLNPANDCTGSTTCINGYFARAVVPSTGTLGGLDLGATVVELTG